MSEALDLRWYRLMAPLSVEVLQYLKSDLPNLHQQQKLFLSGDTVCPSFNYAQIDHAELLDKKTGLITLQATIRDEEKNTIVRDLYASKIDEYLANIELLLSSTEASSSSNNNEALDRFKQANEFLYGAPNPQIFAYTLFQLKRKLLVVAEQTRLSHAKRFSDLWSLVENQTAPKEEYHFAIVNTKPKDTTIVSDIATIKAMFEEGLKEHGLNDTWGIVVDTTGLQRTFSVISHKRLVTIPGQAFFTQAYEHGHFYTVARIRGLIAHEIATHAVRRKNGRKAQLRLLLAGLDHHMKGEEGIATYLAQQENHSTRFAGFLSYLCIGLAYGMEHNGKQRNFIQMHEIFTSYFMVVGTYDEARAKHKAWNLCWRIFRGTACTHDGVVFLKDKLYREGNMLMHELLYLYPEAAADIFVGKFDPTNRAHVEALCVLNILPEVPWKAIATDFCS